MSVKQFKDLNDTQLKEREAELRKHLFDLRAQGSTEKVKDVSQFQKTKRDIARVLTLLRQRELQAAGSPKA